MYKPDIKVGVAGGPLLTYDEVQAEAAKHIEDELPLPIGTRVAVTDDKGRNNELGTIVGKDHVFGAGYEYIVKFDRDKTGWSKNLWTDITSDKNNLLWCNPYNVKEINHNNGYRIGACHARYIKNNME